MQKELKALERLCLHLNRDDDYISNGSYEEDNKIIEDALKENYKMKLVLIEQDRQRKAIEALKKAITISIDLRELPEQSYIFIRDNIDNRLCVYQTISYDKAKLIKDIFE